MDTAVDTAREPAGITTAPTAPPLPTEGFVKIGVVMAFFSCSRSGVWKRIRDGKFPPGVKCGPRVTLWIARELHAVKKAYERGATADEVKELVRYLVAERSADDRAAA